MDHPEKLATLGIQETGRRQHKLNTSQQAKNVSKKKPAKHMQPY
jgi:hypothetical protein